LIVDRSTSPALVLALHPIDDMAGTEHEHEHAEERRRRRRGMTDEAFRGAEAEVGGERSEGLGSVWCERNTALEADPLAG
jgi:hypothetical protein